MIIVMVPKEGEMSTRFDFTYSINGVIATLNWREKFFDGENGDTYFVVFVVCAAIIGLLFLLIITLCIIKHTKKPSPVKTD